jgi:AcrR family transcriptional regulator
MTLPPERIGLWNGRRGGREQVAVLTRRLLLDRRSVCQFEGTMARTLNPEAHAVRRDAFVDAATRLIQTKGYEQLSIADVLAATDSSKGAFYHYFDSKESLLSAVIDRISDAALADVGPLAFDPGLSAIEQFGRLLTSIAGWKNARKELMLAILEVWLSDDNLVVREKLRVQVASIMGPLFARIAAKGQAEGTFQIDEPVETADVIVALILGAQEAAGRLFLDCQKGRATTADAARAFRAYQQALERILGAPAGSLRLVDDETLKLWFG